MKVTRVSEKPAAPGGAEAFIGEVTVQPVVTPDQGLDIAVVAFSAGVLGNQGGGQGIEDAAVLNTAPSAGLANPDVGPEQGKLAPDFEISDFDGVRHRLSDFRGKVVYVSLWATWCGPCKRELPDIQRLLVSHPDDLVVIAVNRSEPLDRARGFLEDLPRSDGGKGVSFTVNGMDPDDTLYDEYRGLGMPVSVFIDPDGVAPVCTEALA